MPKKTSLLLLALLLLLVSPAPARAARDESDRDRDGLQGPVRRVRTETAKLVYKSGKLAEGERTTLETATYDMKGAKIDNAYFLAAGGSLTGKEVYKYDERGNIVEMTLHNADGSVMSKEKYDYEFDAMGNWTKMVTSVALVENGQLRFEPTEVTYRFISYFLDERVAQKLQPAAASAAPAPPNAANSAAPSAAANNSPAAVTNNASSVASAAKPSAAPAQPASQQAKQPTKQQTKQPTAAPPALSAAPVMSASLHAPDKAPAAANVAGMSAAPVVKNLEDLPPAPRRAPVRPVSGGVLNGKAIDLPKPEYPEAAKRMRVAGTVTVEVVIDVNGRVIAAKAVSGPGTLRAEAERAALKARFVPALLSGQPVKVTGQINYNFSL